MDQQSSIIDVPLGGDLVSCMYESLLSGGTCRWLCAIFDVAISY